MEANIGKKNILIFREAPFLIVGSSTVADIIFCRSDNHRVFYDLYGSKLLCRLLFRARFTQPAVFDFELE